MHDESKALYIALSIILATAVITVITFVLLFSKSGVNSKMRGISEYTTDAGRFDSWKKGTYTGVEIRTLLQQASERDKLVCLIYSDSSYYFFYDKDNKINPACYSNSHITYMGHANGYALESQGSIETQTPAHNLMVDDAYLSYSFEVIHLYDTNNEFIGYYVKQV